MSKITLQVNKRYAKEWIVEITLLPQTIASEAVLTTRSGKSFKYLIADAPTWVRSLFFANVGVSV